MRHSRGAVIRGQVQGLDAVVVEILQGECGRDGRTVSIRLHGDANSARMHVCKARLRDGGQREARVLMLAGCNVPAWRHEVHLPVSSGVGDHVGSRRLVLPRHRCDGRDHWGPADAADRYSRHEADELLVGAAEVCGGLWLQRRELRLLRRRRRRRLRLL